MDKQRDTMPKIATPLTDKQVKAIIKPGFHAVGGVKGLYLRVTPSNRYWVFRYCLNNARKDYQFGDCKTTSLKEARDKAFGFRKLVDESIDPRENAKSLLLAAEQDQRLLSMQQTTFRALSEQFIAYHHDIGKWDKSPKDEARFRQRLTKYVYPHIGERFYCDIVTKDLVNVLAPLYADHPSTAEKVKHIVSTIFSWASAMNLFGGKNPVDAQVLKHLLPKKTLKKLNHPMLPVTQIPEFMQDLHNRPSISAKCLEFAILTAVRSANARYATWSEIDFDRKEWVIPAKKMKVEENGDLVVPLSTQAIALLQSIPRFSNSPYVFCSPVGKSALSDRSLLSVIHRMCDERIRSGKSEYVDPKLLDAKGLPRRVTTHGTARATFRTWAQDDELGNDKRFSARTAELCLHHKITDSYDGAYERNEAMKSRREMMQAWADYCYSGSEYA